LPQAVLANEEEVTYLIEENKLYGKGIGYIDAHLLTSSLISGSALWTLDKKLDAISKKLSPSRKML